MNIIAAAQAMKEGKTVVSPFGYLASDNGEGAVRYPNSEETFEFYLDELLSNDWRVLDE